MKPEYIITREHIEAALAYIRENGKTYGEVTVLNHHRLPWTQYLSYKNQRYAYREVVNIAYLYALKDTGELMQKCKDANLSPDSPWVDINEPIWSRYGTGSRKHICRKHNYDIVETAEYGDSNDIVDDETDGDETDGDETNECLKLLRQFKQVIFYGPPGTGKTYQAKATLKNMLSMENDSEFSESQGNQWDIVQFHPSYNYEDFVRGVQVSTNDEKQVKYETKNRIFAEMCDKASQDKGNAYALIIDEINRANVSSVLGELIYALEYRNKSVSTPYEVDGSRLLTIPPNLYIIGTMNTADRTIGALDYAVRRRFAFVHCPPDERLIKDAEAKSVFSKVKYIFAKFLSPDFDAADVEIGHSYFMAAGEELRGKIQYQVVPILEEYVKDGVLLPEAKDKIKKLLQEEQEHEPLQPPPPIPPGQFLWTRDGRSGTNGVGRTVFSIVQDYVENDEPQDIEELQKAFPGTLARQTYTVISYADRDNLGGSYYPETIPLQDGSLALCCNQWGATGYAQSTWDRFKTRAEALGYTITGVE